MLNDGATNTGTVGTTAAAAVTETGTTKAALPQQAPVSDGDGAKNEARDQDGGTLDRESDIDLMSRIQIVNNGELENGAQNEASMDDQKGGTQADKTENDLRNGMQYGKSATDSKNEIRNEGVTHISKAEHISSLEPNLKNDRGTGASEKVCSMLDTFGVLQHMSGSIHTHVCLIENTHVCT